MPVRKTVATVTILLLAGLARAGGIAPAGTRHGDHRGTPRLLVGPVEQPEPAFTPEETSWNYLRNQAALFRLAPDLTGLALESAQESLLGWHFRYRQTIGGVPVLNGGIVVTVSLASRRVAMVYNNTFPLTSPPARPRRTLSAEEALDRAWNHLRVHGELLGLPAAEPVWVPEGESFCLAYRARVGTAAPFGYWELLVDAGSGEILRCRAREVDGVNAGRRRSGRFEEWAGPVDDRAERTAEYRRRCAARERPAASAAALASGSGKAFDPDPKSTLFSDTLNNHSPAGDFLPAYFDRALPDIAFDGGVYRLDGPWVSIQDFEPPHTPPSTTANGVWTALRGDNAFNDVMTYFHIDQNQRYVQSLGFPAIQHAPIPADSDGLGGADNSHFLPDENRVAFGHGGVPDNEDADVILHEYWHAIQYSVNPAWDGADTGAMGEGFGDYWADSYSFTKENGPTFHPDWVFHWDGHNEYSDGRVHDKLTAQYDPTADYPAHQDVSGVNGDELWGTPIWQAFRTLVTDQGRPREEMDRIVIQANYGLGAGLRMPDMATVMVATAQTLYPQGPHAEVYYRQFLAHGILQPPLRADGTALAAEGCQPPNGAADPGETVTCLLTIRNDGFMPTMNLLGTLRASEEVLAPSEPQSYGAILAGGSATRPFTFTVGPGVACGTPVTLTLDLVDDTVECPAAAWSVATGQEVPQYGQDFDGLTAPALPAGWTTAASPGSALWATSSRTARSAPNSAAIADAPAVTDSRLDTAPIAVPTANCRLEFYHKYDFTYTFDCGILEISIDGGAFTEIAAAGGSFLEGGYSGEIPSVSHNPLKGRDAWVGKSSGFQKVLVRLPPATAGKTAVFRFRFGCDESGGGCSWNIDDLRLYRPVCCGAGPVVPGDVNGDGLVDVSDFELLSEWLAAAAGAAIREAAADLDGNGAVDGVDLVLLARLVDPS